MVWHYYKYPEYESALLKEEKQTTDKPVEYLGVIVDYLTSDLTENSFITLQPGESADKIVNLPSLCKFILY